jgi:N-methylhydantoinase A/oxoprolinase/acetone carboxylase beta subunit
MASNLVSFFLEGIPREDVRKIFDIDAPVKFRIDIPVVLIGGPVVAYRKDLEAILDAEVILPEHSDVGNAAGALAAKGVRRVDFLVRPASMAAPDWEYYVFSELGRVSFHEYQEAMQYTKDTGESLIMKYMEDAGLDPDHVNIDFIKEEIVPDGWEFPLQTHMRVIGVGTSLIEEEKT